jgi:hypothetical protein
MCAAWAAPGWVGECAHDVPPAQAAGAAPQKKSLHASERDTPRVQQARARYWQMIASRDARRLKFIDESGVNLAMTRLYGRAPKGERVVGTVPQNYGQHVTLLGALGAQGLHAVMTVEGPMDTAVFRAYVKHVLGPTLTPGDIVVLDNLGVHKARGIQPMLARRRVRLLYLPPTRRTWRPSSPVGRSSKQPCAEPKHAPAVLSTALSPASCRP